MSTPAPTTTIVATETVHLTLPILVGRAQLHWPLLPLLPEEEGQEQERERGKEVKPNFTHHQVSADQRRRNCQKLTSVKAVSNLISSPKTVGTTPKPPHPPSHKSPWHLGRKVDPGDAHFGCDTPPPKEASRAATNADKEAPLPCAAAAAAVTGPVEEKTTPIPKSKLKSKHKRCPNLVHHLGPSVLDLHFLPFSLICCYTFSSNLLSFLHCCWPSVPQEEL